MSCTTVPLKWRRLVAIAVYAYGELRALEWSDVDLEHRTIHVHRAWDRRNKRVGTTKTENTRRIPIHEYLLPLLRRMHHEAGGDGRVFPTDREMLSERTMPRGLRRWLRHAGIARDELFEPDKATKAPDTRKPIRFHDLRATGATWAAVAGVDSLRFSSGSGTPRST